MDLDELYRAPFDEFIARRDALVKELRKDGKRDEADAVKKLKKPALSAWALNQLPRDAIEELLERLRRDPRHTGLEVRDQHRVAQRSFPDWSMELVRVKAGYFEAKDTIADRLPDTVPEEIRARLFRMTELISTMEFD
jgi:hypothetical protein